MVANNVADRPLVRDHRTYDAPVREPVVRDHRTHEPPPVRVRVVDSRDNRPAEYRPRESAQADFDAIFSDRGLSFEDKIMQLLFKVMDKMDKEISKKAKKISDDKDATTTSTSGGQANGTKSFDQQMTDFNQLVNRRNQMFQMITTIVNKFDDSAQKVLQKFGQG